MAAVFITGSAIAVGMLVAFLHTDATPGLAVGNSGAGPCLLQTSTKRSTVHQASLEEDAERLFTNQTVDEGGRKLPRTAFCMSGNIREGHSRAPADQLHQQLQRIDPEGAVFAYINPCEAGTKPWWWDVHKHPLKGKAWQPKTCVNPWQDSAFRASIKPVRMHVYNDADVAPPQRICNHSTGRFVVPWAIGVYQELKGMEQCFRMIEDYERQHSHTFDVVVRVRPDMCKNDWWCKQMTYCSVDNIDRTKVHMHIHFNGTESGGGPLLYWDSFAIVPRAHAEYYFTAVEDYNLCRSFEAYSHRIGRAFGEEALSSRLVRGPSPVPAIDNCSCHSLRTISCRGGGTWMVS